MKLVRFGAKGQEKPGIIDAQGHIRDVSSIIPDWNPEWLTPEKLSLINQLSLDIFPIVDSTERLGTPVTGVRQFVAIGLNYREHAKESGLDIPTEPVVFQKAITSLSGPFDDIELPPNSVATDWELELGFVLSKTAKNVPQSEALDYVAGYCLANDVSERDWQLKRNGQWGKGKSFETFGPIGPWLVTQDELTNPQSVQFSLKVNDEVMQSANTSDMIFSVAEVLSYLSQFMTLLPGDVVITGTPAGVGGGMKPPCYLKKGDVVTIESDVLGQQKQVVV
ncbi:fumarylacetoacetate hydrolase family protein [Acinetobacter ursingii]|uniref:fumarylacetoacetate hydrolase family protein n=1 Tax=Acinetobacter ursingii TaxID=108980 RepID=UPI00124BFFCF|nr:fumarylacetoacetate hydrolase family protein [Acinetobacter ursingii]MCU4306243.1 fumarylacetoacetate hydrolase family protein [Acinetobacter ursingii]MCU4371784.1 fumarylacetoacetate hydrolase family protein [Acinetobacter ursingii]MCU4382741.1 fumarylacetoacetate hydrolase family protein [Acinetobacter ursingii]MDG9992917.1 fumarylacetoacetate hydrolase family protein [Acinetobacter ursingii]MDH0203830.1 fumarylacetoacetate hydrolase family protein [Acinetobacter ursingii]